MKKNSLTKKQHRGFSLIELVIVVAIIGILALMIIPQFNNVTDDAKVKTWQNNCQTIVSAINMYLAANDGAYPTTGEGLDAYINGGWAALSDAPSGATYNYEIVNNVGVFTSTYNGESYQYPTNVNAPAQQTE